MLVCSKRVFLNVLTQFMDAETLINANYYIADQTTRNGIAKFSDSITINDDGSYTLKNDAVTGIASLNPFHIIYGPDTLSPITLMSDMMSDVTGNSTFDMFKNKLMQNESLVNVYNFLYSDKAKGNGLKILIFVNDCCVPFIHIVCEYLAGMFGDDLTFVDKMFRVDIPGNVNYVGNGENAKQVITYLNDYRMVKDIHDLGTNYQYGYQNEENLRVYFDSFTVPQLFHIYEKLFPYEPLAPDTYTKERMVYILTGKIKQQFPPKFDFSENSNLMIPSFEDMVSFYENISEDELMTLHE